MTWVRGDEGVDEGGLTFETLGRITRGEVDWARVPGGWWRRFPVGEVWGGVGRMRWWRGVGWKDAVVDA